MRDREEIKKSIYSNNNVQTGPWQEAVIEVLLDIRNILNAPYVPGGDSPEQIEEKTSIRKSRRRYIGNE